MAWLQERWAQLAGKPARLLLSQVRLFHNVAQEYDINKAKSELGFNPRPPDVALGQAFAYLYRQAHQPYEHPPQAVVRTVSV